MWLSVYVHRGGKDTLAVLERHRELLKALMRSFIDDVEGGTQPAEAGWISGKGLPVDEFVKVGIAERGEKGIRLVYGVNLRAAIGKVADEETEELVLICQDITEGVKTFKIISRIFESLPGSPSLQAGTVILGWWRMLATSDFPVVVDEVLRQRFSPDEWYIEAPKASIDLALSVGHKWWGMDDGSALESISDFASLREIPKSESADRVMSVLRWDDVLGKLTKDESKALAIIWVADHLCATRGLYQPESVTFVQRQAWNLLEQRSKKKKPEIVDQIEAIISSLPSPELVSWPEIIRFPW